MFSDSLLIFLATRTEHARRARDMSSKMEERMHEAQAEVVQEKEDKRDISTGVYAMVGIFITLHAQFKFL